MTTLTQTHPGPGSPRRPAAALGGLLVVALAAILSLQVSSSDVLWHPAPERSPGATLVGPSPAAATDARGAALVRRAAAVVAVCLIYLLAVATGTGRLAAAGAALALASSGLFWTRAAGGAPATLAACLALAIVGAGIWRHCRRSLALVGVLGLAAAAALVLAGDVADWRGPAVPDVWTTAAGRLGAAASLLATDFGVLGLGFLVAGAIRLALDRVRWPGLVAAWVAVLTAWALGSGAPDWPSRLLPAVAPLWLVVAAGMDWTRGPSADPRRRPAVIAVVLLLPAMNLAANHHAAGDARAGRAFVERYVGELERRYPDAPIVPTASRVVETGFAAPPGAVALAEAQAAWRQLGYRFTPVSDAGVAMTLDELVATVPSGWIVALAIGDRFALGVRPGAPTFQAIGGAIDLFEVRRDRYVIVGVKGRAGHVIERVSPETVEVELVAGDALGPAFRVPAAIRLASAQDGAVAEFRGRRVASSRTGVAVMVVTPSGTLAGAYGAEMGDGLRILVDPPSLAAAVVSGREPCVEARPGRWTDVSGVAALASLGGVLTPGQTTTVYVAHSRPLDVRRFDVRHPWVPAVDVRTFEREDPASVAALGDELRADGLEAIVDPSAWPYVYRVEAVSTRAGRTELALRLGGFAERAWARATAADGAGPLVLCAAMRGRELLLAGRPAADLDLADANLFVFGWHRLEHAGSFDFRWTRDYTAEVLVPLARRSTVALEIEAVPALLAGTAMQVRINDVDLDRVDLSADRRAYRWAVPAEAWRVGLNRVQIVASDVIRPADLGMSDDQRRLGIAVSRLRLVPRDESP